MIDISYQNNDAKGMLRTKRQSTDLSWSERCYLVVVLVLFVLILRLWAETTT